jgi:putative DNA primase/helicase
MTIASAAIPDELKEFAHWVCWKWKQRAGRRTKLPVNPTDGTLASATDPETLTHLWPAISYTVDHRGAGLSFVFSADDPFAGVDLDNCVDEYGKIAEWAETIVRELNSYTEFSPSGTGLKIFLKGTLPTGGRNRKGDIEMYDRDRFFTVTARRLHWTPKSIEDRQTELTALHRRVFGEPAPKTEQPSPNGHKPSGHSRSAGAHRLRHAGKER